MSELEFNGEIEKLIQLNIKQETIKNKITILRDKHRSKIYTRKWLKDWISKIEEQQAIQKIKESEKSPLEIIFEEISKTVKQDKIVKLCNIATAFSTYTKDPLNSYIKGGTSIGKTYSTMETLKFFPEEDIWSLGGMSPTALMHEKGIWLDEEGIEIKTEFVPEKPKKSDYNNEKDYQIAKQEFQIEKNDWNERLKNSYKVIDLSHKILQFLEPPHSETLQKLFPILSHDKNEVTFKITDKNALGQLETITTKLRGFPAVFLCSTRKVNDETVSRFFTYSPENTENKYIAANKITNQKFSEKWKYENKSKERKNIELYIRAIRRKLIEEKADILIPFTLSNIFPNKKPEDMRHFKQFLELIQSLTVLNIFDRTSVKLNEKIYYISSIEDTIVAYLIYQSIIETTETGEEQNILDFYHNHLEINEEINKSEFFTIEGITNMWNDNYNIHLSKERVRVKVVDVLVDRLGYLDRITNPTDKRQNMYRALKFTNKDVDKSNDIKLTLNSLILNLRLVLSIESVNNVREWIKNSLVENNFLLHKKNNFMQIDEIDTSKIIKKIYYINNNIIRLFYNDNLLSDEDIKLEDSLNSEIRLLKANLAKINVADMISE